MNDFVHTGIAVRDLSAAMQSVGGAAGVTWATPQLRHLEGIGVDGPVVADVRVTWSIEGPPHLELVEGGPGTVWEVGAGVEAVLHHVAYWTDDLAGDVARMRAAGCALELTGAAGGGEPSSFAYLKQPGGIRVELMDRAVMKPAFDAWLAGGSLPGTVA